MAALAETTERKKTVADFPDLGEGLPFGELIKGNIVMAPSPFRSQKRVIQRIFN